MYFGWYVVLAGFCIALFGWGLGFYGLGVYLPELQARHGWSAGLIGGATTAYYLFGALLLPGYSAAAERLGPRAVTAAGIGAMALSVASLPFITAPWQLFAAYLLMAVGWATMSITAVTTLIAPWFVRRRGLAISLALNGASCGGVLVAPALVWLAGAHGFTVSATTGVAAMLAVLVPVVLLFVRRGPRELGLLPDGDGPDTGAAAPIPDPPASARPRLARLGSLAFWGIATPFALGLMAQVGFITHQIAFLTPRLGANGAGLAVALTTLAAVAGRVGLGLVVDRLDQRATTAVCLASQAAALGAMTQSDAPGALYAASIVFGLSVGNLITLPALIVQREYPVRDFGLVVGLVTATSQVAYAFGPGLLGLVRDLAGGYHLPLGLCVLLQLAGAASVLAGRRFPASAP